MRVVAAFGAASVMAATDRAGENPIRRIVNMLQGIQEKVEAEGKTQDTLFDKFVCYCQRNTKELGKSIEESKAKITALESSVESSEAEKTQVEADLVQHKTDRTAAKGAIEEATEMRTKENSEFSAESGDLKSNIDALNQAIPAIEKGMAGSFLQTGKGALLSRVAEVSMELSDGQKSTLQAFLQGSSEYAPASGQIVGILKTMKEEMEANLAEITKNEQESTASHNGMIAAKNSEIAAATDAIEEKTARAGDLAVQIVEQKNDLKETKETLAADEEFLVGLTTDCDQKAKDYEEVKKARAEELVAIADTIKMLNSDDALELFKKAVPSPSLLQMSTSVSEVRARALAVLRSGRRSAKLDLVMMALHGQKGGFNAVAGMIDGMAENLAAEQVEDDKKLEYCKAEIQKTEDEGRELVRKVDTLETRIEKDEETLATLKAEIKELGKGIKSLDKAVAEATEQRKADHEAYVNDAAQSNAALDLLGMAKNRLNKFYNPEVYKEEEAPELSEADKLEQAYSFVQVRDAPEAPPEVGSFKKSESGGVVGLMDMMINDLKKEMQEDEFAEKNAQEDYERLMADSKEKRAADSQAVEEKKAQVADGSAELQELKVERKDRSEELGANKEYVSKLHTDCDWNMENYESRKAARSDETDSLHKAKDVLEGADFSLLQVASVEKPQANLLSKSRETSCSASDLEHRRMLQSKFALLQGFCEDMCKVVGSHPNCAVCEGFVPDLTPGVQTWDELYAQFDKLKLVGRDMIKEWTGDAGKFGR
jgi:chromosome segregation ATPase